MPPDGIETLARWREAGEWWAGEPGREVHRFIGADGIRREAIQPLAETDEGESLGVRIRRSRDEKVQLANRTVLPPNYGAIRRRVASGVLLHARSGYAFGSGTMIAGEIPALAAHQGYEAALLADPYSLTGAVEFCRTAGEIKVKPLVGATFELPEGGEFVLVAKDSVGYRSLSRLITDCHLGEPRHYPLASWDRLARHAEGLLCLTGGGGGPLDRRLIRRDFEGALRFLARLIGLYGRDDVFVQVERSYLPWERSVEPWLLALAEEMGVVAVAGGPALHERRDHFPAHDVLVCVETLCLIDDVEGRKPRRDPAQPEALLPPRRSLNAERYLRPFDEMQALYVDRPDLIENAERVKERCEDQVLPDRTVLPRFCDDEDAVFRKLVDTKASQRYPVIEDKLKRRIDGEVKRIIRLKWARHFLVAWEMCEWAEGQGILLSGRGSVVDSVVAYCLGLSRIDAFAFKLHFDRFLPADGSKRPDIDIDFESARREDVRQHLVQLYGDAHVATVAAVGTYGSRGLIREVGKVMGIPEASIGYLAKRLHGGVTPERLESALQARPELRDSGIPKERFHWVFKLAERLMDLPRNLRSHSSGVILSETPIADTVPVQLSGAEGVKIIQWDKRSAKRCFDKFDVLCLRGNDVMGGTARNLGDGFDVTDLPLDDPEVFRTFRAGQLVGIPQSASPAMRQAHIRIGTKDLKEAGIVQAGIRPGVGGAVKLNEYVARRKGKEFRLVHPDMEAILLPTLGIVVFQEQIDQLLHKFGGYTGDEAEEIRENIHKHHQRGYTEAVREDVLQRILSRGYSRPVAREVYELIAGFKGYGFAEGHALSFAEVSIRSVYLQQNFPAPYFAALLDAQPAGYYGPVTLANEARSRGVRVLPPCVNASGERFGVEDVRSDDDPKVIVPAGGIRVPLRQVGGLAEAARERALLGRPYESFFDFVARAEPARDELEALILCGAFDALHSNRRALLWAIPLALDHGATVRGMWGRLPLGLEDPPIPDGVDDFPPRERAIWERRVLGLDVERHLMAFERERIAAKGGLTAAEASRLRPGTTVFVVGNPIRLRFPPTQSGRRVMFFDLEDETGLLNVTCFDETYQRDGHKVICHPYVTVWGDTQDRDGHLSFLAHRMFAYEPRESSDVRPLPIVTADFLVA